MSAGISFMGIIVIGVLVVMAVALVGLVVVIAASQGKQRRRDE